mmetsp:Transcript_9827/g.28874  ORF Transcript_9827/g.28874 Transcript_9827/m.28874 type:complete len:254 (-) Transcript_9827:771-1532(-)
MRTTSISSRFFVANFTRARVWIILAASLWRCISSCLRLRCATSKRLAMPRTRLCSTCAAWFSRSRWMRSASCRPWRPRTRLWSFVAMWRCSLSSITARFLAMRRRASQTRPWLWIVIALWRSHSLRDRKPLGTFMRGFAPPSVTPRIGARPASCDRVWISWASSAWLSTSGRFRVYSGCGRSRQPRKDACIFVAARFSLRVLLSLSSSMSARNLSFSSSSSRLRICFFRRCASTSKCVDSGASPISLNGDVSL